MQLYSKPIEGDFQELIEQAKNGDMLLVYEGEFEDWVSIDLGYFQGVIIRKSHNFYYLNGDEKVDPALCQYQLLPCSDYTKNDEGIYYKNELIYRGLVDEIRISPYGIVLSKGKQIWLIIHRR